MTPSLKSTGREKSEQADEEYPLQDIQSLPAQNGVSNDGDSNSTHDKRSTSQDEGEVEQSTSPGDESRKQRASLPGFLKPSPRLNNFGAGVKDLVAREANFYRVHVTVFTLTPLIFSAIFYASNSTTHIAYIDCLFLCVSAMTVTGLTTINISIITAWQQAILYFLMTIGNLTFVSIIMVLIRRHFFRLKFEDVIQRSSKARKRMKDVEEAHQKEKHREFRKLQKKLGLRKSKASTAGDVSSSDDNTSSNEEAAEAEYKLSKKKGRTRKKVQGPVRADMIRRMDGPAVLINQAGMPSRAVKDDSHEAGMSVPGGILNNDADLDREVMERSTSPDIRFVDPDGPLPSAQRAAEREAESTGPIEDLSTLPSPSAGRISFSQEPLSPRTAEPMRTRFNEDTLPSRERSESDPMAKGANLPYRRASDATGHPSSNTSGPRPAAEHHFPRTHTVEFSEPFRDKERLGTERAIRATAFSGGSGADGLKHRSNTLEVERFPTSATTRSGTSRRATNMPGITLTRQTTTAKERGFGGFPTPFEIATSAVGRAFPKIQDRFTRSTTMPRSTTFTSIYSGTGADPTSKPVPYLTFDATVSRNSRFQELTEAQRDELGGVEYRAVDLLAKILPAYWLFFNFFFITLVAPWLASKSAVAVHEVLATQGSNNPNTTWMWFFQIVSAYSNSGLSLIDTSMTLLPEQFFMLIPMAILILAGNTAFPIFLRFFIWLISQAAPKSSRLYETLRFLLDHPRRCFVYLFPSGQTWFLFAVLVLLNCTDFVAFQVLDIGNPAIATWSVGQKIFDGLFQSIAVRAAGFNVISLLSLAPGVQFLYIVMMYISAYPVAMSVRNTNVYEERSLGLYNEEPGDAAAEPQGGGAKVWGNYLAAHARRQLAFDIWWLGFALWLICIIQRHEIQDPASDGWFTIFNCLFELTSAYGTVGLSTGTPYDDFSLSGRFRTLGKLVVIAVMLRGRHRGLPVAIDRAVLLPGELDLEDEANEAFEDEKRSRTITPSASGTFFGRTPTGYSTQGSRRLSRTVRDRNSPSLDLDTIDNNIEEPHESVSENQDQAVNLNHYPHLTSIQESSPSNTPRAISRVASHSRQEDDRKPDEEASSSASSSSKGKEVESREMIGSHKVEQLPSAVDSQRTEEEEAAEDNRLDELNKRYQDRYGSISSGSQ